MCSRITSWLFFFGSLIYTFGNYLYQTASSAGSTLNDIVVGNTARLLIVSVALSLLTRIGSQHQVQIGEAVDHVYCLTGPTRYIITDAVDIVGNELEPFICLNNLYSTANSMVIHSAIKILYNNADIPQLLSDIKDFIATVLKSTLSFFFLDKLAIGNRADIASVVTAAQVFVGHLKTPVTALCADLGIFIDFYFEVIGDSNLACAADYLGNTFISFWQMEFNFLLEILQLKFSVPEFSFLDQLCSAGLCTGNFIDDVLVDIFKLFMDNPPTFTIGCMAGQLLCALLSLVNIILTTVANVLGLIIFPSQFGDYNFLTDTDFTPFITRIDDTGQCLQKFLSYFDQCLGQAAGNAVRLVAAVLRYFADLIQLGENNFGDVVDSLDLFVGQSTYGGGLHVFSGHSTTYNQTSLTCFISNILNWSPTGTCNVRIADATNSIVELFIIPFHIVQVILDNLDLLQDIDGNPLSKDTRDDFTLFFELVLDELFLPVINVLDYFAHIPQCITSPINLVPFGDMLVTVVFNFASVWTSLENVVILLIETVVQFIIVIISIFAGDLFPNESVDDEFVILGSIFVDLFLALLDFVIYLIKFVINYGPGFFFPALFGQPTLYASSFTTSSSPATLTACIEDFAPGCICGLSLSVANEVCLPDVLGGECLGELWPGCGKFQATPTTSSRRRFTGRTFAVNATRHITPFEYYADTFPEGMCGMVFQSFRNYMDRTTFEKSKDYDMTEAQITMYVHCLNKVRESLIYDAEHNYTVGHDYLVKDYYINTTRQVGLGIVSSAELLFNHSWQYMTSPEYLMGKPGPRPILATWDDQIRKYNITDHLAVHYLNAMANSTTSAWKVFTSTLKASTEHSRRSHVLKAFRLGKDLTLASLSAVSTVRSELSHPTIVENAKKTLINVHEYTKSEAFQQRLSRSDIFTRRSLQKRHHDGPIGGVWFPNVTKIINLDGTLDDQYEVTQYDIAVYPLKKFGEALRAAGGYMFGAYFEQMAWQNMNFEDFSEYDLVAYNKPHLNPAGPYDTVAPYNRVGDHGFYGMAKFNKRNLWADINKMKKTSYNEYAYDDANVHTGISYLYGTGGRIDFQNHIPNSCGTIHMYCDNTVPTGCGVNLDYIQTLGLCQDFIGPFGIVMQCNDTTQAFAVYANKECSGDPIRIAIATPDVPLACARFRVAPLGPVNDFFCIRYDECTACPVKQFIPGFNCAWLDEAIHELDYAAMRCLVKFIGPIYPPFNYSNAIPPITNVWATTPTTTFSITSPTSTQTGTTPCSTCVCGDRILCTERDNSTGLNLPCEQCDNGNKKSGDGCSSSCKIETCFAYPRYDYIDVPFKVLPCTEPRLAQPYPGQCLVTKAVPTIPVTTLTSATSGTRSYTISTQYAIPLMTSFDNSDCSLPSSSVRALTGTCAEEAGICYVESSTDPDLCYEFLSVGKESKKPCLVCGNGIVDANEMCDTNPFLPGSSCIYCIPAVTCDPNHYDCLGVCLPTNGYISDPNRVAITCHNNPFFKIECPNNAQCVYFQANGPILKRSISPYASLRERAMRAYKLEYENFTRHDEEHEKAHLQTLFQYYRSQLLQQQERRQIFIEPEETNHTLSHYENDFNYSDRNRYGIEEPFLDITQLMDNFFSTAEDEHNLPDGRKRSIITQQSVIPKSDFLLVKIDQLADDFRAVFLPGFTSVTNWGEKIKDFFIGFNTDVDSPVSEWNAVTPFVWEFRCNLPTALDGSRGLGVIAGTGWFLKIALLATLGVAFFFPTFNTAVWSIFAMLSAVLWTGLVFGYPLIGCNLFHPWPRIPETVGTEAVALAKFFNGTCVGLFDDIAISPCTLACERLHQDCRALGFVDGFDSLVAVSEIYLPSFVSHWLRNSAGMYTRTLSLISHITGEDLIGSYNTALANFNFQSTTPTAAQRWCTKVFAVSVIQIVVPILLFFLFGRLTYAVLVPLVANLTAASYLAARVIDENFIPDDNFQHESAVILDAYNARRHGEAATSVETPYRPLMDSVNFLPVKED